MLVLTGALFVVLVVDDYRKGHAFVAWPSTTGVILSTTVEEDMRTDRTSHGRRRTRRTYTPAVRYEYVVEDTTYLGHRIRAGDYGGDEGWAYGVANRYPVGTEATVYYNSDDPGSTVLEQGADRSRVYLFGGTGVIFALIGLVALAAGRARRI